MSNIFKAKEAYKQTTSNENPDKPLVPLRGLYVAGIYRPPYWIDHTLSLTNINTTPANVVYYTNTSDDSYDQPGGLLRITNATMSDISIVDYTVSSDYGYDDLNGLLRITNADIGTPTVISYTSTSDYGYEQPEGVLRITDAYAAQITSNMMPSVNCNQPPGQPVLNIKSIETVIATVT